MRVLPAKAQSLQIANEEQKLEFLTLSEKYSEQLNYIRKVTKGLVSAFNENGASIEYEETPLPSNLFSEKGFELKISVSDNEYWSIHLVDRDVKNIGIMFVRMNVDKDDQHYLTNDSIVFRWFSPDQFGFSLNDNMSDEAKGEVAAGLSSNIQAIDLAQGHLETLIQNIIKYTLAKGKPKNA